MYVYTFTKKDKSKSRKHKLALIAGAALVGCAIAIYKHLPSCVTIENLVKDEDALWHELMQNAENPSDVTSISLILRRPGTRLGKFFIDGGDVQLELGKEEALELADKIYHAFGESYEKAQIIEF